MCSDGEGEHQRRKKQDRGIKMSVIKQMRTHQEPEQPQDSGCEVTAVLGSKIQDPNQFSVPNTTQGEVFRSCDWGGQYKIQISEMQSFRRVWICSFGLGLFYLKIFLSCEVSCILFGHCMLQTAEHGSEGFVCPKL